MHLTISCVSLSLSLTLHTHKFIARQAELSMIISSAAINLKKVGVANLSHTIITTRINSHEKNWSEFQEYHRLLCTLRDSVNFKLKYFTNNIYSTTEEAYLLGISTMYSCLKQEWAHSNGKQFRYTLNIANGFSLAIRVRCK